MSLPLIVSRQAYAVLHLDEWASVGVEHADEKQAWAALYDDAHALLGQEVYVSQVETGKSGVDTWEVPKKARVVAFEARPAYVNVNDDAEWYYIDPYVDVDVEGVGRRYTYGRTHKWRKA